MGLPRGIKRVNVRYDPEADVFSMRCDDCYRANQATSYWPLDTENWDPRQGLQRCRACHAEKGKRQSRERRRLDPTAARTKDQRYYDNNRETRKAYARRRYRENREEMLVKEAARRQAKRERQGMA